MTEITRKDIEKTAKLARIELSERQKDKFTGEIKKIFTMIDSLSEVNTDNIPEMAGVGGYTLRARAMDEVSDGNIRDEVLANAPKSQFGCFVVPKVVGE